jgi:hypothetical protein
MLLGCAIAVAKRGRAFVRTNAFLLPLKPLYLSHTDDPGDAGKALQWQVTSGNQLMREAAQPSVTASRLKRFCRHTLDVMERADEELRALEREAIWLDAANGRERIDPAEVLQQRGRMAAWENFYSAIDRTMYANSLGTDWLEDGSSELRRAARAGLGDLRFWLRQALGTRYPHRAKLRHQADPQGDCRRLLAQLFASRDDAALEGLIRLSLSASASQEGATNQLADEFSLKSLQQKLRTSVEIIDLHVARCGMSSGEIAVEEKRKACLPAYDLEVLAQAFRFATLTDPRIDPSTDSSSDTGNRYRTLDDIAGSWAGWRRQGKIPADVHPAQQRRLDTAVLRYRFARNVVLDRRRQLRLEAQRR